MSAKVKKIILSGYYGFDNAGDEAVLAALCQILRNRLPEAQLVALSAKPEQTAAASTVGIKRLCGRSCRTRLCFALAAVVCFRM